MSISGLMIHRADVLEMSVPDLPNMDVKRTYTKTRTVACRFSSVASRDLMLAAMRGSEVTHRVYFDEQPNLNESFRLRFGGVQYILLGVPDNPSHANRLWQLDVKMVTHQNETVEVVE